MTEKEGVAVGEEDSAEFWLSNAQQRFTAAVEKANSAKGFAGRWKIIASNLALIPTCLSDLSSHPCFSKNAICRELLRSIARALSEVVAIADCSGNAAIGKLWMQSDLDALAGKLELFLRDCGLVVKTGVLGEATVPIQVGSDGELEIGKVRELLARLQIGHAEAKNHALDCFVEAMREDEKTVIAAMGRSNVSALVQLLSATSLKVREKAATAVCLLVESGNWENLIVSEGVLPPLIRLLESGSLVGREKAVITLQRLSVNVETARSIAGHGGIGPLIEVCKVGDSISQTAAAGTLKNVSAVPEIRQVLVNEGIVRVMIDLLDCGIVLGSKEYAAECLQNLTSSNDCLKRMVVSEGGIRSLISHLDGPIPQEFAVNALRNLVDSVSTDSLVLLDLLPRLVHVLKDGSLGAQQAAATAICKISISAEMKKMIHEFHCIPFLINMLEAKTNGAREAATQAIACLMSCTANAREIKRDEKCVPNLVQLLDPSPQNTAKKYAVLCLLNLSSSKKCKKMMISYGANGYLRKLSDMNVPGAKKLLERLEKGRLQRLLIRR